MSAPSHPSAGHRKNSSPCSRVQWQRLQDLLFQVGAFSSLIRGLIFGLPFNGIEAWLLKNGRHSIGDCLEGRAFFSSDFLDGRFAMRCVMEVFLSGLAVLLVADVLHPVHDLAIELLLSGDVRHGGGWRGAVPVFLTRLEPDHVAGPDFLDGPADTLDAAPARDDDQRLAQRMGMPCGAGAGLERDDRGSRASRVIRLEQGIDAHRASKPVRRTFDGGLGTISLDVHEEKMRLQEARRKAWPPDSQDMR